MPTRHESFTLKRTIAAPVDRVFAAWSDPGQKRRWFVDSDGDDWQVLDYGLDFRVGGREHGRFLLKGKGAGAGEHANETVFLDIVPGVRIIFAYSMTMNGQIHSASLATVQFHAAAGSTRLTYTEQGAFFGASDGIDGRKAGWNGLLDALATTMKEVTV